MLLRPCALAQVVEDCRTSLARYPQDLAASRQRQQAALAAGCIKLSEILRVVAQEQEVLHRTHDLAAEQM